MKLEECPPEVLSLILDGENSWAAIELWKTGNRALNQRLANGGVRHMDLKDNYEASTSRWPRCLKEFKLTSLSLHRAGDSLARPETLRSEIKALHSGLKSLELRGGGLGKALLASAIASPSDESSDSDEEAERPAKRSKSQESDASVPHVELWNIGATWPQLERFAMSDTLDGSFYGGTPYDPSILSLLPKSLTSLEFAYLMNQLSDLNMLPQGLTTLHLQPSVISEEGIRTLPKSITNIGDSLNNMTVELCFKEPDILPNLILPGDESSDPFYIDTVREEGIAWPNTIRFLHLDEETLNLEGLPSSITSLHLDGSSTPLHNDLLPLLPSSLTALEIANSTIKWDGIDVTAWPSTLTSLKTGFGVYFGAHCFHLLPRSLKTLFVGERGDDDYDDADFDNGEGTDARIESETARRLAQSKDLDNLRSLGRESLKLEMDAWNIEKAKLVGRSAKCDKYVSDIEAGGLLGLPLSLTELNITMMECNIKRRMVLPPKLRLFSYAEDIRADDPKILCGFSPIGSVEADLRIRGTPKKQGSVLPTQLALFHASLTSLTVHFEEPTLERSSLKCLPRTLKTLSFSGPLFVFNEELAHLPRHLESLSFNCAVKDPSSWVHHLPKGLTRLEVNLPILGSEIAKLPPKLTHLGAAFFETTLAQVRQLPRTLRTLTYGAVEDDVHAERNNFMQLEAWETLVSAYRPFYRLWEASEAANAAEIRLGALPRPTFADSYPLHTENQCYIHWVYDRLEGDADNDNTDDELDENMDDYGVDEEPTSEEEALNNASVSVMEGIENETPKASQAESSLEGLRRAKATASRRRLNPYRARKRGSYRPSSGPAVTEIVDIDPRTIRRLSPNL